MALLRLYNETSPTAAPIRLYPETPKAPPNPNTGYFQDSTRFNEIGASTIKDTSGKPFLTYSDQTKQASVLDTTRVATKFDPRIPQRLNSKDFYNPRAVENRNQLKQQLGGSYSDELDHRIALALSGSNQKENLQIQPGRSQGTAAQSDKMEGTLAKKVANGDISLFDAQIQLAQSKGSVLPFTSNKTSSSVPAKTGVLSKINKFVQTAADYLFPKLGGNAIVHPVETLKNIVNEANQGAEATINNLVSNAAQFRSTVIDPTGRPASEKAATTLNLLHSIASTALFPISETYNIASHLPVIKPAADAIGVVFDKSGKVVSFGADKLLDKLPISQQARDTLRAPIENVSSLAGQVLLGGFIYDRITRLTEAKAKVTDAQVNAIVEDAHQKAQELNTTLRDIQTETPSKVNLRPQASQGTPITDITPPPGSIRLYPEPVSDRSPVRSQEASPTVQLKTEAPGKLQPIPGTGETKTHGLAQGVEAKAIENKLTNSFGDLPEYQTVNMKDQAQRASELLTRDYEHAKRIALGQEVPPKDLIPESVFVAVENRAIKEGDVATLRDLATSSGLTSEATTMGQRIRTLAERDPESPVSAIKDIQIAREKAAQRRLKNADLKQAKKQVADQIKSEIKKTSPTRQTWAEFVKSIEC